MSPADPDNPNEAARLTQQLIDHGYTKRQIARMLGRDASLVSQFFTKGKGAAFVNALRQVVRAVRGGERDTEALGAVAQENVQRRRTRTGQKARVRGKDVVGAPGESMAGRAGKQAIRSGASHLAPVVHETGRAGGRLAFTVRMKADQYTMSAGSTEDSPGLRRGPGLGTAPAAVGSPAGPSPPHDPAPGRGRPPRPSHSTARTGPAVSASEGNAPPWRPPPPPPRRTRRPDRAPRPRCRRSRRSRPAPPR
ncbi:hypothetical protein [Kitasatospora aureofaciens]|uniref:hypothetical protein n=1 Tax=Kitasatospora aureofaciens TaxID=1894 RepID=UPI00069239D8|nr:hypothetical protein [Kitasatospora aureofaciens]